VWGFIFPGVEEVGEAASEGGGIGEKVGGGWHRNAGPVAEESPDIFGAVLRAVHDG
jgi:hypothetical protein